MTNEVSGKELREPIPVTELLNGQRVGMVHYPYHLSEAEFLHLKQSRSPTSGVAAMIFAAVIAYGVSLGPKMWAFLKSEPKDPLLFTSGEWATLFGGMVVGVVAYLAGFVLPNEEKREKKQVLKKISAHFKTAKPSPPIMIDKQ